ncbi:hypothetical protein V5O48_002935 [Marasmius crinis-equi]|uniref:Uncharacterized protein n=1 Tax=Marasmius crinis-equi TaxID=585013 RepID=A0ABR3FV47_9AGAR
MARLLALMKSPCCTLRPYLRRMTIDPERDNELWLDSFLALTAMKGISLRHLTVPNLPKLGRASTVFNSYMVPLISLHINIRYCTVEETMRFVCVFSHSLENLALRIDPSHVAQWSISRGMGSDQPYSFPRLRNLNIEGPQPAVHYMDWFSQCAVLKSVSSIYLGLGLEGDCDHYDTDHRVSAFLNSTCATVERVFLDYNWVSPVSRESGILLLQPFGTHDSSFIPVRYQLGGPVQVACHQDQVDGR